jgi:hypothetical protein
MRWTPEYVMTRPLGTALAIVFATMAAAAHPGHGTMAIVGTLLAVEAESISIEARDVGDPTPRRITVGIGPDTKLRVGKETIATLADRLGASVVATVDYEERPDGRTEYYATKVQVNQPRKKRGR